MTARARRLSRRKVLATAGLGSTAAMLKACGPARTHGGFDEGEDAGVFFDENPLTPDAAPPARVFAPDASHSNEEETPAPFDAGADSELDGGVTPQCEETEENIIGPFYRANAPVRNVLASPDDGEWLVIRGSVSGRSVVDGGGQCAPLNEALLDVWQANALGEYDMSSPSYPWRGRLRTDANGQYKFETILPGRYLNGPQYRPRHIHLMVSSAGHVPLITQLYFEGDPFIASDPFVRPSLVIALTRSSASGVWEGTFPIVLARR